MRPWRFSLSPHDDFVSGVEVSVPGPTGFCGKEVRQMSAGSIDRLVGNHLIFREVNERIHELAEEFALKSAVFLCECSTADCGEFITLDLDQYKAIRSLPTLFVIAPGHETPKVENVVETNDRYALVENTRRLELVTEAPHPITERRT